MAAIRIPDDNYIDFSAAAEGIGGAVFGQFRKGDSRYVSTRIFLVTWPRYLLLAGGYAPAYSVRPLGDGALYAARKAVDLVLAGHEPLPALAVDRHWNLIAANRAVPPLLAGAASELVAPPINVLRLSLHPDGLAPRIVNLPEWRAQLLERLRHQVEITGDPVLAELLAELRGYPVNASKADGHAGVNSSIVVPLELATETGTLRLFSTTTIFGTPLDVTVSEIAIESFFPADEETAALLRLAAA